MRYGIVFGGKSFEHEISIVSAIAMKKVLKYKPEFIFVDQFKDMYHIPYKKMKSKLFSTAEYKKFDKLFFKKGGIYKDGFFGEKKIKFDMLLNLIHGQDGEDGKIASVFEFYDIKYIGPRVEASVVSYNKLLTKIYAKLLGVKALKFQKFSKNDKVIVDDYPAIIKPARLGSSIGVSVVSCEDELEYALDVAFEFDDDIIIEPFINNIKELNLAGAKIDGKFYFSTIEEPSKDKFLDFDKKYLDFSRTKKVKKADINDILSQRVEEAFKTVYNTTFEGSIIRCDFFIYKGEVVLNEINSIPGSYANYLFDDFNSIIDGVANSLPKSNDITVDYAYVNKIQSIKGK
ncbi:MAG: D-alanine--D-alanine ligase A [Campylobacteraceae bacterium 4484_166]|nr:MAG: D-alanine--D-alanine ligase A [Campylobacteraceae bacterium 4484_166]